MDYSQTMATTVRQARLIDKPELLRERLRAAPRGAGVYVMRDLAGRVAYVGKADNVQNRLRSASWSNASSTSR